MRRLLVRRGVPRAPPARQRRLAARRRLPAARLLQARRARRRAVPAGRAGADDAAAQAKRQAGVRGAGGGGVLLAAAAAGRRARGQHGTQEVVEHAPGRARAADQGGGPGPRDRRLTELARFGVGTVWANCARRTSGVWRSLRGARMCRLSGGWGVGVHARWMAAAGVSLKYWRVEEYLDSHRRTFCAVTVLHSVHALSAWC
mmetsp:Transcript_9905/g.26361  ORF Transcript_9905/g.26361 Transcript_9905/m.26361 type:complete len:202 (-) Transcript_9905:150-755(-)